MLRDSKGTTMALDHAAHETALDEQLHALGVDKLIDRLITRAENSYSNGGSADTEIVFSMKESKFYIEHGKKIQLLMNRYKDNNPDQQIKAIILRYQNLVIFGRILIAPVSAYLQLSEPMHPRH